MNWGLESRNKSINKLDTEIYDLVIIGGGITGAGVLLDAASRGIKAILIEKGDFASGTSSRSTKLIHGGLRYLKNLEFKIVRETGQERAIAYKNAPHLVIPEKMILPIQKGGTYGKFTTSLALKAYDWLAGVVKEDRRKMLDKQTTLQEEPLLKPDLLKGSGFYSEYRTDDARLTLEIIKTALQYGGDALNYTTAKGINYDDAGQVNAIDVTDEITGKQHIIKGKQFINACGPWSDEIREMDQSMNNKRLHLTKGVHIVFDHHKLPLKHSVYFDVSDGRMIFAIPRGGVTYVGTTDTDYDERKDNPDVQMQDVSYLLRAVNDMFPSVNLTVADVESSWAGLRPLIHEDGKSPSELSRKDEIFLSSRGMITIAGGKLTGYRVMAKKVVDIVASRLSLDKSCQTETITISGYLRQEDDTEINNQLIQLGYEDQEAYLKHVYGSQAIEVLNIFKKHNLESIIEAESMFAIHNDMCFKLIDFYVRRTGRMYFNIGSVSDSIEQIGKVFAKELNWTEEQLNSEKEEVLTEVKSRTNFI